MADTAHRLTDEKLEEMEKSDLLTEDVHEFVDPTEWIFSIFTTVT